MEVPSRVPRYTRPARLASGVPAWVTSGYVDKRQRLVKDEQGDEVVRERDAHGGGDGDREAGVEPGLVLLVVRAHVADGVDGGDEPEESGHHREQHAERLDHQLQRDSRHQRRQHQTRPPALRNPRRRSRARTRARAPRWPGSPASRRLGVFRARTINPLASNGRTRHPEHQERRSHRAGSGPSVVANPAPRDAHPPRRGPESRTGRPWGARASCPAWTIAFPGRRGLPARVDNRLPWERGLPARVDNRLPWERGLPARVDNRLPWERGLPARVDNHGPSARRGLEARAPRNNRGPSGPAAGKMPALPRDPALPFRSCIAG